MAEVMIRDLPISEQPIYRVTQNVKQCSNCELLATIMGNSKALTTAQEILSTFYNKEECKLDNITIDKLQSIENIGTATAARIVAAIEFGSRIRTLNNGEAPIMDSPRAVYELMFSKVVSLDQEYLWVVVVNTRNRVIKIVEVYHGNLSTNIVRIAEIFKPAILANAKAIIVVHNHPSGDPTPSTDDIKVTQAIIKAGKLLDIEVLDHIIMGKGDRYISLKSRGLV